MTDGDRPGFPARWATFVSERFPPASHVLMAGSFFAGNAAAAVALAGSRLRLVPALCGGLAVLLIFLRLRIFDEIKDSRTDRDLNPGRPLARGLISSAEAWRVALAVAAVEAALAAVCGVGPLAAWAAVFGFSLLMFREFFVGTWLRPKMELYAVAHTLVAGWMGLFVAAAVCDRLPWELPAGLWLFVLANWAVFNVFEFARKTWGADEERPGVESYSGRLRPAGAALLTMSQIAVAAAAAWLLLSHAGPRGAADWTAAAMLALTLAVSLVYVLRPRGGCVKAYRLAMSLFIVGYYLALAACIFLGKPAR